MTPPTRGTEQQKETTPRALESDKQTPQTHVPRSNFTNGVHNHSKLHPTISTAIRPISDATSYPKMLGYIHMGEYEQTVDTCGRNHRYMLTAADRKPVQMNDRLTAASLVCR